MLFDVTRLDGANIDSVINRISDVATPHYSERPRLDPTAVESITLKVDGKA